MPVKECTADDETDYITLKDGTGRPNNSINMSLQDTCMLVIIRVHEFEKLMSFHYTYPLYLRLVFKCPFYTTKSLTVKHELQIQPSLPETNYFSTVLEHLLTYNVAWFVSYTWIILTLDNTYTKWHQFPKAICRYEAVRG